MEWGNWHLLVYVVTSCFRGLEEAFWPIHVQFVIAAFTCSVQYFRIVDSTIPTSTTNRHHMEWLAGSYIVFRSASDGFFSRWYIKVLSSVSLVLFVLIRCCRDWSSKQPRWECIWYFVSSCYSFRCSSCFAFVFRTLLYPVKWTKTRRPPVSWPRNYSSSSVR